MDWSTGPAGERKRAILRRGVSVCIWAIDEGFRVRVRVCRGWGIWSEVEGEKQEQRWPETSEKTEWTQTRTNRLQVFAHA